MFYFILGVIVGAVAAVVSPTAYAKVAAAIAKARLRFRL